MITLTITAAGEDYTRAIDPNEISLGFLEDIEIAQETGKWRDLIPALATLLDLPRAAVRQVSIAQFKQIAQAIADAGSVPNGSAPNSA